MLVFLLACVGPSPTPPEPPAPGDCSQATNVCPDYAPAWTPTCPPGERCIRFINDCAFPVLASYEVGCNGNGEPGAPQCGCTQGPTIAAGQSVAYTITDGDYDSCLPSWEPPCLTAGLAVMLSEDPGSGPVCSGSATRIEFTAGNSADVYGRFDSYDIDVEKGYGIPVTYGPELACARDTSNHDCRPLTCDSATCPDAYSTPTSGGCSDGRSPQVGCQDTFANNVGYVVVACPAPVPASCRDANACP